MDRSYKLFQNKGGDQSLACPTAKFGTKEGVKDEEFSDEKLENLVLELSHKSAKEILTVIQKEVHTFASGAVQSDDITLMAIKVK